MAALPAVLVDGLSLLSDRLVLMLLLLQALVGEGVGPDTPLSVILSMLTGTPQLGGLTAVGAAKRQQGGNDDIGPRVLFADD